MKAEKAAPAPAAASSLPPAAFMEVRYPLPAMLAEIQLERAASSFAMEKLDQVEIGKLFKSKKTKRGKPKK